MRRIFLKYKKVTIFYLVLFMAFPLIAWGTGSGIEFPTDTGLSNKGIKDILVAILTWMLGVVGVVALIGFVISGSMYVMSTGDDKAVENAKNAMKNSIIGMVVVLASFVIIQAIDAMLKASSGF